MNDNTSKHKTEFELDPKIYTSDKVCINVPSVHAHTETFGIKHFVDLELEERVKRVSDEFIRGFTFIKHHPGSVTFFGSARLPETHAYYEKARNLAKKIVNATGYSIVTGGGPGIMEAGNRGASEADVDGKSIGLNIELPHEQVLNPFVDSNVTFYYFFTRKVALTFSAEAYIFFPGGFGTLDEFFEIITLMQTNKITKAPVILYGGHFWDTVDKLVHDTLLQEYETISPEDRDLYLITEDDDEICNIIKNAPQREE